MDSEERIVDALRYLGNGARNRDLKAVAKLLDSTFKDALKRCLTKGKLHRDGSGYSLGPGTLARSWPRMFSSPWFPIGIYGALLLGILLVLTLPRPIGDLVTPGIGALDIRLVATIYIVMLVAPPVLIALTIISRRRA